MSLAPPWSPGQSGNPRGRPKGSPHRLPTIRAVVSAVITDNIDGIRRALSAVLTDPDTVVHGLELAARLNRELGPPRLVLGEEAMEAGGLTVVLKQYVIGSAVTPARPASAGPPSLSPEIESLPVQSDRPMETAPPLGPENGGEAPTSGPVDETTPADTVRITLKHFVDPEPR
jgi:Family of unknown function (DUF5681)